MWICRIETRNQKPKTRNHKPEKQNKHKYIKNIRMLPSRNTNELYFCEDNQSRKYKMSQQERKELYVVAQKYKNINSIIIRKWLLRPYYVGDKQDVKQLMKHASPQESITKNEIKTAKKHYILDNWIHYGVYTIKKDDIDILCT